MLSQGHGAVALGECSGELSGCKICKHLTARKEEAFYRKEGAWLERTTFRDRLCGQPLGEGLMLALAEGESTRASPCSESDGEERILTEAWWSDLTSLLFRWRL